MANARKLHADQLDISPELVGRLIAGQFPQWADQPLREVVSTATVNALFRLGPELLVRLCRVGWAAGDVTAEYELLRRLAPGLPVPVPEPVAIGAPTAEYPWTWAVLRWLPGTNPVPGRLATPERFAADLAGFIRALRAADLPGGPPAYRGGSLSRLDTQTREAIAALAGTIDTAAATAIWQEALGTPEWAGPDTWVHADLLPGNLLTVDGRLSAVIDFATVGIGDPACDLIVAWNLLPARLRPGFRAAVGADDATWTRARARALSIGLISLPYYRETAPGYAAEARYTIEEAIADHGG